MKSKMITFVAACLIAVGFSYQANAAGRTERAAVYQENDTTIFTIVNDAPQYPGGEGEMLKFISRSVKYPVQAQEKKVQGRVVCSFVVEKDGTISNVEVSRGVDPMLDTEAMRIISSMPKWTPGKDEGKPVRVRYTLPIQFRLQGSYENKNETSSPDADDIFTVVENSPRYPGGEDALLEFVKQNIQKDLGDKTLGMEGRVILTFIVEKDGSLSDVKIARGIDPALDKIALNIVHKMPKWQAGTQRGNEVRVRYTLPISFKPSSDNEVVVVGYN